MFQVGRPPDRNAARRGLSDGPVRGVGSSHGGDCSNAVTTAMPMPQTGFIQVVGGFPLRKPPFRLASLVGSLLRQLGGRWQKFSTFGRDLGPKYAYGH